jgi:hypothetical protein
MNKVNNLLISSCGFLIISNLFFSNAIAATIPLDIKIIYAHNEAIRVDSKIKNLVKDFGKIKFSAFDLKNETTLNCELTKEQFIQLPNNEKLRITAQEITSDNKLRLEIFIEALKFKTVVSIDPLATVAVGGPLYESGVLILAISRELNKKNRKKGLYKRISTWRRDQLLF